MGKTKLSIEKGKFYINGIKTYSEFENCDDNIKGLLMNARFIQGVFDDKSNREKYNRFGVENFDPEENTNRLIEALPKWYERGLRAFTVSFQGGGPCYTIKNDEIDNNPYEDDGRTINIEYAKRMDRLIKAADEIGMVGIVSMFYFGQIHKLKDGRALMNAIDNFCEFINKGKYTNIIIEVAQEYSNKPYSIHPLLHTEQGLSYLMRLVKSKTGVPVGSSDVGGKVNEEICKNSDVILIHGNGCSYQELYKLIKETKEYSDGKPVFLNEDSQCIGNMKIAIENEVSWGYYNNMTKQEPPSDWGITKGEDEFFAYRLAKSLGIMQKDIPDSEQFYFQGFEKEMTYDGKRWLRLASLYPEKIKKVEFYKNDEVYYVCYCEPFSVNFKETWIQGSVEDIKGDKWKAVINLHNGEKREIVKIM